MEFDTDVLIVGAGPTGLMLACQLAFFGVSFRIIDTKADRSQESRAFGIQAKSMEIFQKIGLIEEFLQLARPAQQMDFYIHGRLKLRLHLNKIKIKHTPFPALYFLPQSETERILNSFIEKRGFAVERQMTLVSFSQTDQHVKATIKQEVDCKNKEITCRYIVGCDGARSTVRHLLDIPFIGGDYSQEFILADAKLSWENHSTHHAMAFLAQDGFFLHLPLTKNLSRIIVNAPNYTATAKPPLTLSDIETIAQKITHAPIQLSDGIWMSRFSLHHRAVRQYQKGRAFIAGDAAHIHSPVGAQGMNTGIQDATNLAWKIAATIKISAPTELLDTYELERQLIGKKLLSTTDRFFKFFSSPNKLLSRLRPMLASWALTFLKKFPNFQRQLLWFASQLGIYYPTNKFIYEKVNGEDKKFISAPKAGHRAPDSPLGTSTIFKMLKGNFCSLLIFYAPQKDKHVWEDPTWQHIEKSYGAWLKIHKISLSSATKIAFDLYGVANSAAYFIRPDGYIGFRENRIHFDSLLNYLKNIFGSI